MAQITYSISWDTPGGQFRQKFFHSVKELKNFRKSQLKFVNAKFRYFVNDGVKKEQFVFIGNLVVTKRQLLSYLNEF